MEDSFDVEATCEDDEVFYLSEGKVQQVGSLVDELTSKSLY